MAPQYSDLENIPCEVKYLSTGLCSVTFVMPEHQINGFVLMLSSLAGLFRGLGWKAKTNIDSIHQRNESKKIEHDKLIARFESDTVETFRALVESGVSPRESLSLTVSRIHCQYEFSSYEIVKNCLTKNKCLKKTGFYKEKR